MRAFQWLEVEGHSGWLGEAYGLNYKQRGVSRAKYNFEVRGKILLTLRGPWTQQNIILVCRRAVLDDYLVILVPRLMPSCKGRHVGTLVNI